MLIRSSEEEDILSASAIVSSNHIGDDKLHGVTHVRARVHVGDRSGNISGHKNS